MTKNLNEFLSRSSMSKRGSFNSRGSFSSRGSLSSLASLDFSLGSKRSRKRLQHVTFDEEWPEERVIERTPDDCYKDVYYTGAELDAIRRKEVIHIRKQLAKLSLAGRTDKDSLEDDTLSWRGIEDHRDGRDKGKSAKLHSAFVVHEYENQQSNGIGDGEVLRQVAKTSSRDARKRAAEMGDADAQLQGHKPAVRGVKRTVSNFMTARTRLSFSSKNKEAPLAMANAA